MTHICTNDCPSCPQCYVKYGEMLCEQICKCSGTKPIIIHISTPYSNDASWIKRRFIDDPRTS